VSDIFEVCGTYLGRRFERLIGHQGFEVKRIDGELAHVDLRPNSCSEIFINGTDVTVRLQLFFNKESFRGSINHLYAGGATDRKVEDFFNELANLVCGRVKHIMILQGANAALSLPIAVKICASPSRYKSEVLTHVADYVVQKGKAIAFAPRVSLAIHKRDTFANFDPNFDERSEQDGDAEFF
jgi:hypothetical protein